MALLHENELFPHPLNLLFQICSDDGQIIQSLSEAFNFNFQIFLEGVFIFVPLVGRERRTDLLMEGHSLVRIHLSLEVNLLTLICLFHAGFSVMVTVWLLIFFN